MTRTIKRWTLIISVSFIITAFALAVSGLARSSRRIPRGSWGGSHINVQVTASGADIEFDCGGGSIKGPLKIGRDGKFSFTGIYQEGTGSPSVRTERQRALYTGWTDGKRMTLKVTLADGKTSAGEYELRFGQKSRLDKCPASRQDRNEEKPAPPPL